MSNVKSMNGRLAVGVQWLPCIETTINDQAQCNGWIFAKSDDGFDPCIEGVYQIDAGQWVDEIVPPEKWEKTKLLFMAVVIDPMDFPYTP